MSLYHDATAVLDRARSGVSMKSIIYDESNYKSPPTQLYALISETIKWNDVLKDVVERSDLLSQERKVISGHSEYNVTLDLVS